MDSKTLKYLRTETTELIEDIPTCNWLYKLDNQYLKNIADKTELHSIKERETYFYINFLISSRYK